MNRLTIAASLLALAACARSTHPEPDSAVMEPAADGSHWATPAGTRVYQLYSDGELCFVAEGANGGVTIHCLPASGAMRRARSQAP